MKKALAPLIPLVALFAVQVPSALASSALCSGTSATAAFAPWGDLAYYTPFTGDSFENGASGWSWGNKADIVNGDDDHLLGGTGSHAVELPANGIAKSPWLCVDSTMPSLRFFVRRVSGTGNLTVKGTLAGGALQLSTITTFAGSSAWQPSPIVAFPSTLTTAVANTSLNAQFQFIADPGTVYRIDDVAMDPFKGR